MGTQDTTTPAGSRPDRRATVVRRAMAAAIVTMVTVGGAMSIVFLATALGLGRMGFATPGSSDGRALALWFVATGLLTVLAPPFAGGALWGAGIARILDAAPRPVARTGALAFGGMVVLTAAPTDLTQLWLDDLPAWIPLDVHGYFTIVFMVEVGVVAAVATWRLARRLEATGAAVIGAWTGAAAALGFLAGSALAIALGVRVFPWQRLSMVWATLIALPVCTMAAGGTLGALLSRAVARQQDPLQDVDQPVDELVHAPAGPRRVQRRTRAGEQPQAALQVGEVDVGAQQALVRKHPQGE